MIHSHTGGAPADHQDEQASTDSNEGQPAQGGTAPSEAEAPQTDAPAEASQAPADGADDPA